MGSKTITQITATQTTINDTDNFILQETGGGTTKKTVGSTIKSWLKTYFDTLYSSIPAGTVIESANLTAPTGWLSCNGAAVSRTTYSTLYDAITASKGTVTITSANPGVVSLTAHGLSTGSCIELTTTGTLPTNLSANTNYYVIYVNANTFRLATSAANAIAGTAIDTSGGSPSGTHTLRYCPYGISGASNFLLPNRAAVVGVGAGSQTINTRAKTAVLGLVEEDQMQGHYHSISPGATNQLIGDVGTGGNVASTSNSGTSWRSNSSITSARTDGTNGDPRTGSTTRENRIGMNYYIKY
jgi:microcystin-dependent protein